MSPGRKTALTLGAAGLAGAALLYLSQQQEGSPDVGPMGLLWNPPTGVMTQGPSPTAPSPTPTATPTPNATTGWYAIPAVTAATVNATSGVMAPVIQTVEAALRAAPTNWWKDRANRVVYLDQIENSSGLYWWWGDQRVEDYLRSLIDETTATPTATSGGPATNTPLPTSAATATPTRPAVVQGYFAAIPGGTPVDETNTNLLILMVTFLDGAQEVPTRIPQSQIPTDVHYVAPGPDAPDAAATIPADALAFEVAYHYDDGEVLLTGVHFSPRGYFLSVLNAQQERRWGTYFVPR